MKKVLVVMGQHRSGTSMLAGCLNIFGGYLGKNYVHVVDEHNEKGFFEPYWSPPFNDKILSSLDSTWDKITNPKDNWHLDPKFTSFKSDLKKFLINDLDAMPSDKFYLIKDPRISVLLPLYLTAFRQLNIEPAFIFSQRPVAEITASIIKIPKQDHFNLKQTQKMVDAYERETAKNIGSKKIVWSHTFDCLSRDPEKYFKHLKKTLRTPLDLSKKNLKKMNDFIDMDLRHHKSTNQKIAKKSKVTPLKSIPKPPKIKFSRKKTKRMAFVAGGWHYPKHFYEMVAKQEIPKGWKIDLFVVGHRAPPGLKNEKQEIWDQGNDSYLLYKMDRALYKDFATKADLKDLGWKFTLEENTIGDYEFLNQWLAKHNHHDYDIIATSHDDLLPLNTHFLKDVITNNAPLYQKDPKDGITTIPSKTNDWLILSHTTANSYYYLGNTLEFFRPEAIDLLGGKFDSTSISLKRVGLKHTPTSHDALSSWDIWSQVMIDFIELHSIQSKVKFISPHYRVSPYAIECERGFVHRMTEKPDEFTNGINELLTLGIIKTN